MRDVTMCALPVAALGCSLLLLAGCNGGGDCGPGEVRVGGDCYEGMPPPPPPPPLDDDAGAPVARRDAGPGTSRDSGPGRPPPSGGPPGCDEPSGECAEWAAGLATGVSARQMEAGCGHALMRDDRIDAVAQRHARHQANIDHLSSMSPDGDLFDQVQDAGVSFSEAAALFAGSRGEEPERIIQRWADRDETNEVLSRCDDLVGVGVATAEMGTSYITVLLVKE